MSNDDSYVETEFRRDEKYLSDRLTADGSNGRPVEPGRYRLIAARACPWANRSIIVLDPRRTERLSWPTTTWH